MATLEWTRPLSVGEIPTKEMRDAVSSGDREVLLRLIDERGPFRTFKAWTDIAYWRGVYYCIFYVGATHWSRDGHCEIFASEDSETWRLLHRIEVEGCANDPKLLATEDRLVALTLVAPPGEGKRSRCCCSYTENGNTWSAPSPCAPEGLTLWYPKKHESTYYACGYGLGYDVALLSSTDGLSWDRLTTICQTVTEAEGETCLHFFEDGRAIAIVRQGINILQGWADVTPNMCKVMCCNGAPYTDWYEKHLKEEVSIEGHQCLEINGKLYVCGRNYYRTSMRRAELFRQTVLFRFEGDHFVEDLVFPSGGDTGYCGMLIRPDGKLLVSYYTGTRERADIMVSLVNI